MWFDRSWLRRDKNHTANRSFSDQQTIDVAYRNYEKILRFRHLQKKKKTVIWKPTTETTCIVSSCFWLNRKLNRKTDHDLRDISKRDRGTEVIESCNSPAVGRKPVAPARANVSAYWSIDLWQLSCVRTGQELNQQSPLQQKCNHKTRNEKKKEIQSKKVLGCQLSAEHL